MKSTDFKQRLEMGDIIISTSYLTWVFLLYIIEAHQILFEQMEIYLNVLLKNTLSVSYNFKDPAWMNT